MVPVAFFSGADGCLKPRLWDVVLEWSEWIESFLKTEVLLLLRDSVDVLEIFLEIFNQNLPEPLKKSVILP